MKVALGLLVVVLIGIAAAIAASGVRSGAAPLPANQPWALNRMEYVAWNGARWTAWIRDGTFELVPEKPGRWSSHSNPRIAFIDWEGEMWQARIEDGEFLLAYRGNWKDSTERSTAIGYRDWMGENRLRTVAQLSR